MKQLSTALLNPCERSIIFALIFTVDGCLLGKKCENINIIFYDFIIL